MADTAPRRWRREKTSPATSGHRDEWRILWGLFTQHEQQHQEQLCWDLLQLPAASVNQYLLQYVYLAVSRPSGPLERAIVELCGRSFNTAMQVSWLLLALLQDQPGNQHIRQFKDACEVAALLGGKPSHPHYLQISQHPQQSPTAAQQQPWPADEPTAIPIQASVTGPTNTAGGPSSHCSADSRGNSRASTPFAAVVGDTAVFSPSPPSSPSAAAAAFAASSLLSTSSISSSHRFRDSLDFELMRQTSHQDLFAATAAAAAAGSGCSAAAGSRPGSPTPVVQQLQQQQGRQPGVLQQLPAVLSTPPKGLPPIRTNSTSGAGSNSTAAVNRRYQSSSPRLVPSPRKARQPKVLLGWAVPGSVAAAFGSFEDYFAVRKQQLVDELGEGEGVSGLMAASHAVEPQGVGWLVTHEEEPLSASLLLSMPPRSPRHAAGRDSYLATLDFVAALCETSSSLTRFPPDNRRKVLRQCLSRISQEVEYAAEQGVAVRYPIGGCESRVLRLLVNEAAILNSRDKAPFLLLMEVQRDQDFVDEVQPEPSLLLEPFTAAAAAAAAADASCQQQPTAAGTEAVNTLPDLQQQQQQQQQQRWESQQQPSPTKAPAAAAAAAQLHLQHHHQQQQQHTSWQRDGATIGRSPLSRGASPIPITPRGPAAAAAVAAAMSAPADLAAAAAPQGSPAAAAAGGKTAVETTITTDENIDQLHMPIEVGFANSAAAREDVSSAAAALQTTSKQQQIDPPIRRSLDQQYHHHQQQQQQQQRDLKARWSNNLRRSLDHLRVSTSAQAGSTGSSSMRSINTAREGFRESVFPGGFSTQRSAAAAAAVRRPTALDQQMQEAVARLRGDAAINVIKLHLRVVESGTPPPAAAAAAAEGYSSPRKWSGNWSPTRRRQQQQQESLEAEVNEQIHSSARSQLRPESPHSAQLTADRVESPSAEGPWLFGELPAESSSNSLIMDTAAAASSNRYTVQGNSSAAAAVGGGPVAVRIEVLGAPPVVHHLSAVPQAQPRRRGRRLPSVEAIDIIAGKLGSAVPPPTEIGPPLRLSISSSSSSSSSSIGENDPADQDLSFVTSPVSTAASGDVRQQQQQQQWVSVAGRSGDCGSDKAGEVKGAAAAVKATAAAAAAEGSASRSTHVAVADDCSSISSKETAAAAAVAGSAVHQSQQQQQQPASTGWWGFLRKPLGRQHQHRQQQQHAMPTQQQQQQPSITSQQQQQQQQIVDDKHDHEQTAEAVAAERSGKASAVYGERWSTRTARVQSSSTYSSKPGWDLSGLIVKSGDDCRQELLALQLITEFGNIWADAGLPLWVNPFEVLVTSNNTALIELIPDATSIHSIKARSSAVTAATASNGAGGSLEAAAESGKTAAAAAAGSSSSSSSVSLSDHFFAKWRRGSAECVAAQQRFVESLAAYSLVTYLLQVKDRHNGNIMLDDQGHIIHIDFGFMLSNAPGGNWVRFEAAPFKLTREMLEVMDTNTDGQPSELFDYFKVLCIQGFLVARRKRQRIVSLVRIMAACSNPGSLHPHGSSCCHKRSRNCARKPPGSNSSSGSSSPTNALSDLDDRWQGSPKAVAAGSSAAAAVGASAAAVGANGPAWPCFRAGPSRVVSALEARFAPQLSDTACVQHVLRLIGDSLDAWSTRQYDFYQRVLNGIL